MKFIEVINKTGTTGLVNIDYIVSLEDQGGYRVITLLATIAYQCHVSDSLSQLVEKINKSSSP